MDVKQSIPTSRAGFFTLEELPEVLNDTELLEGLATAASLADAGGGRSGAVVEAVVLGNGESVIRENWTLYQEGRLAFFDLFGPPFYSRGYSSGTHDASPEQWLKIHGSYSFSVSLNNER